MTTKKELAAEVKALRKEVARLRAEVDLLRALERRPDVHIHPAPVQPLPKPTWDPFPRIWAGSVTSTLPPGNKRTLVN